MAIAVGVLAAGCSWLSPEPEPVAVPDRVVSDEETIPWAKDEPLFVVARLSCRTLDVYKFGKRIRTYDAVFGMGGVGKSYQGDRRTPIGLYSITHKYPHERWRHFMLIDYPNATDKVRHAKALASNDVPDGRGPGSAIGIHGTDKPDDNRKGVDWTHGCISVSNRAINDLNRLLPVGTPVLIQE